MTDQPTTTVPPESVFLFFVLAPALVAWSGYVLSILWGWFIVPLGVIPLPLWHASGVAVLAGYLTKQPNEDKRTTTAKLLTIVFTPAVALGLGAIYHALM